MNEPTRPCASPSPRAADRGRRDHDRVHAAELAVERDGVGASGGEVEQGAAAGERAGEAGGLDDRMLHQRVARPRDPRPARASRPGPGRLEGGRDDLGRPLARARGVPSAPSPRPGSPRRAPRRCRRRRPRTRRGSSRPRTPRPARRARAAASSGRGRGRRRVGVVDGELEVRALLDDGGEQAQLPGGAADLAAQPRLAEARLRVGDRDELVGGGVERVGHRAQPRRAVGGGRTRRRDRAAAAAAAARAMVESVVDATRRMAVRHEESPREASEGSGEDKPSPGCGHGEDGRPRCDGRGVDEPPRAPKPASSTSSTMGSGTPGTARGERELAGEFGQQVRMQPRRTRRRGPRSRGRA